MEPVLRPRLKLASVTMRPMLRTLAVLLLAVALPLQGLAAVSAGQCMAFGHHEQNAGQENDGHAHDGAGAHDHAEHAHADGAPEQAGEGSKSPHCGPCTACCASASIAGPGGISIPSSPSAAKYVFSQSAPPGFEPDGLDRPPLAL